MSDGLLHELYSDAAGYVLPSEIEGMSHSILDATAFGSATVMSSIPPNANLIGDAGLAFETGDVEELPRRSSVLLSNPHLTENSIALSRERADGGFNWDRIANQSAEIYDELVRN